MKGVIIINMGGPQSLKEMKVFLWNMFNDKHILPFIKPFQLFLAWIISSLRYKKSWAKYLQINGTPIVSDTKELSKLIDANLGDNYKTIHAFSYSKPLIKDAIFKLKEDDYSDITIVPLYPHYSISTWLSVANDAKQAVKNKNIDLKIVNPFFRNKNYINYFSKAIEESIKEADFENPLLLFSAHSIPTSLIDKGDYYESEIVNSSKLIADHTKQRFTISYQSQMGKKWLGPITEKVLEELDKKGEKEVLIIPISFVGENLETLYDINKIMIPNTSNLKIKVSKMKFSKDKTLLAKAISEEVIKINTHGNA
jgi:ferrochelatase